MVKVEEIFREDLDELIRLSYKGDEGIVKQFHIKEYESEEQAVQSSLEINDTMCGHVDLSYYKVLFEGNAIGYFVTFPQCLYSFSIAMEYRVKEVLSSLFDKIVELLGDGFGCILYKNNSRAISWLMKCGMEIGTENEEDNSVVLIYKNK